VPKTQRLHQTQELRVGDLGTVGGGGERGQRALDHGNAFMFAARSAALARAIGEAIRRQEKRLAFG
jgi:hypothetical protein